MRAGKTLLLATLLGLGLCSPAQAKGRTLVTLHTFCSETECVDGRFPVAGLVRDSNGDLYGTAEMGGTHDEGVVYRLKRKAEGFKFEVLHSFCSGCGEGAFPASGLIVDGEGNLYGTTLGGGTHGCGAVFKLSAPKWKLKTLHSFCSGSKDGDAPSAALSYAGKASGFPYDGVSPLFGTTARGGAHHLGALFKLEPMGGKWHETVLHAFCGEPQCADGAEPSGELLVGPSGDLFGNAVFGGANGHGITFRFSPAAESFTAIHSFCAAADCSDGNNPRGTLVMDATGALFGTTENTDSENGLVFKLMPDGDAWQASVMHTFCSPPDCADGYAPNPGLVMDDAANLYGVTELGGTGEGGVGGGTAYRIKHGEYAALYQFCSKQNCADGRLPQGTLILDPQGSLFGTTSQGGENSAAGTVFMLVP